MISVSAIQQRNTKTVEEAIISDSNNPISTSNTMISYVVNESIVPLKNAMSRYYDLLITYTETEALDKTFYMKPGYYCYKKYGTYSMDHIIMSLNNVIEPMEFKMDTVSFLTSEGIGVLLGLMNRDSGVLSDMQSSVGFSQYQVIKEP